MTQHSAFVADINEGPGPSPEGGDGADDAETVDAGLPPESVKTEVADSIRDMIIQDVLPPGRRISERALAERLGVSRTPVREALKILIREGLLESRTNRRTFVAAPQPAEISDTLLVLAAVEGVAGEMALERMSDAEISEIRALHHEMLAAYARGDRLGYFKKNQEIHLAIVAGARCASLSSVHAILNAKLYRVRYQANRRTDHWVQAVQEHEDLLVALERRDRTGFPALLREHVACGRALVQEIATTDSDERA